MDGTVRLRLGVNRVRSGNPAACLDGIKAALASLPPSGEDLVVFPRLALCPPSAGSLAGGGLAARCESALGELLAFTAGLDCTVAAGLILEERGAIREGMAVVRRGELLAFVPADSEDAPVVFRCGRLRFAFLPCELGRLASRVAEAASLGVDLVIVPAYGPVHAGFVDEVLASARIASRESGVAVAVVNGGAGDTSSPWLYKPFAGIYEGGEELIRHEQEREGFTIAADLDADIIRSSRSAKASAKPGQPASHSFPASEKQSLLRPLRKNPWLPSANPEAYLCELFWMQAASLAARMENAGIERLVIGVSGGLDSTAALFAAAAACDMLSLPRTNILGVTMPGFGTSDRTRGNADKLLAALGVAAREISIKESVELHFRDIGHGGGKDAAYENAQARERAQILFDLANMERALVVGTGDLSEAALGFTTFAGDHIANYNVNVCITKTLLRELVRHVAEGGSLGELSEVAADVLATPVSPELLPPGESGDIEQKTEEILGPYLLHDFFLYHLLRHNLPPKKLLAYAVAAFEGEHEPAFIREKLSLFYRKFAAGQFKRACSPDAASITEWNLLGVKYSLPSDLDAGAFLL